MGRDAAVVLGLDAEVAAYVYIEGRHHGSGPDSGVPGSVPGSRCLFATASWWCSKRAEARVPRPSMHWRTACSALGMGGREGGAQMHGGVERSQRGPIDRGDSRCC